VLAAERVPDHCPALVLNADYRPLSYFPLSLWSWQDTIKAVFLDRVNIVQEYERVVHSPSFQMKLPSVVSLKTFVKPSRHPAFTRFNVFLRDNFSCQYCSLQFAAKELQFEHVIPRSKGGETCWENIVAACQDCNARKADRLEMKPNRHPHKPSAWELLAKSKAYPPRFLHQSWVDYLYWDSELQA